jgi:hypothetical protein
MNPPGSGELHVEPGQAVGAFVPGLSDTTVTPPPPHMPAGEPVPVSGRAPKPPTSALFFILGFFSPYLVGWILSALSTLPAFADGLAAAASVIYGLGFIACLAMLVVGRSSGNVRLASFGKGGVWSYCVSALLLLAAFGVCAVSLGNYGK